MLADQPALDGQYTVFGHVSDGMEVLQKISETPVDATGLATERVEIRRVDDPRHAARAVRHRDGAGARRATAPCSRRAPGPITIEFFADKAPEHVRQFLRLAAAGVYNGMAFHRVAPGFVIQTGALSVAAAPLTEKQQTLVHNLQPEFNDTKHVKGIVSMARGDDPASATTSFFICTGDVDRRSTASVHGVRPRRGRDGGGRGDRGERRGTGETPNDADRPEDAIRIVEASGTVTRGSLTTVVRHVASTLTTTPTRYSTWMRSPGSRLSDDGLRADARARGSGRRDPRRR